MWNPSFPKCAAQKRGLCSVFIQVDFFAKVCSHMQTVLVTHGASLFVLSALKSQAKVPSSPAVNCHSDACLMTSYLF